MWHTVYLKCITASYYFKEYITFDFLKSCCHYSFSLKWGNRCLIFLTTTLLFAEHLQELWRCRLEMYCCVILQSYCRRHMINLLPSRTMLWKYSSSCNNGSFEKLVRSGMELSADCQPAVSSLSLEQRWATWIPESKHTTCPDCLWS